MNHVVSYNLILIFSSALPSVCLPEDEVELSAQKLNQLSQVMDKFFHNVACSILFLW